MSCCSQSCFLSVLQQFTELFGYGSPDPYFYHMQDPSYWRCWQGFHPDLCLLQKGRKARLDLLLSVILCGLLTADLMVFPYASFLAYEILVNLCLIAFSLYTNCCGDKIRQPGICPPLHAAITAYRVKRYPLAVPPAANQRDCLPDSGPGVPCRELQDDLKAEGRERA